MLNERVNTLNEMARPQNLKSPPSISKTPILYFAWLSDRQRAESQRREERARTLHQREGSKHDTVAGENNHVIWWNALYKHLYLWR